MPPALVESREALATMLSCDSDDLALIENATSGVNTILRSFDFKPGDEILVPIMPIKHAGMLSISLHQEMT